MTDKNLLAALQRSALRKRHHFQQPIEIGFVREVIERGVLLEKTSLNRRIAFED